MKQKISNTLGFSIIEVIVFVSLLSIVLVAAVGYTVRLVFTMNHNRHKLLATHYTDEVKEWLNSERESDWEQFQSFASTGSGSTYCLNESLNLLTQLDDLQIAPCAFTGVPPTNPLIYQRQLILSKDRDEIATRVFARIQVSWRDEGVLYTEDIETVYSIWE